MPSLTRPYPFDPHAIQRLVYGQGTTSWVTATKSLIRRRFGEFIARHTLSEFLAAVGAPELEQDQQAQAELRQAAEALAGATNATSLQAPASPPDFLSRTDVMTGLFTAEFGEEAARRGGGDQVDRRRHVGVTGRHRPPASPGSLEAEQGKPAAGQPSLPCNR